MTGSMIRKTSVIWWMLVLAGMVMSCTSPAREAGRAAVTVQEPVRLPLTRGPERVPPVPYPSATDPQDEGVAVDKSEEDAVWSYLAHVFQKLESQKRYPRLMEQSGLSGRVVLRFTVRWDGEIIDPQITEVTGHESFGNAALQALSRVGHLPRFPDEIRRRELMVEVPISYRSAVGLSVSKDDAEGAGTTREPFLEWAVDEFEVAMNEAKAATEQGSKLGYLAAFQPLISKLQSLAEEGDVRAQAVLAAIQRSYVKSGGSADGFEALLASGQQLQTETWRCFELFDRKRGRALLSLIRMRIGGEDIFGEVSVAGISHMAQFQVAGLNRRWDWGCNEKTGCQYTLGISPDGTGKFYDFSVSDDGRAKPSQVFECQLSP